MIRKAFTWGYFTLLGSILVIVTYVELTDASIFTAIPEDVFEFVIGLVFLIGIFLFIQSISQLIKKILYDHNISLNR